MYLSLWNFVPGNAQTLVGNHHLKQQIRRRQLYITPPVIHGETYFDGGSAFYDVDLFAAAMEPEPISLLSLHFAEPPNHSYGFGERLNLARILFDTHNFTLPEVRRRMRKMVNLFYDHAALRRRVAQLADALEKAGGDLTDLDLPDLQANWQRVWQVSDLTDF